MKLEGTFTALLTPFRPDGALDLPALAELVEWQIDAGIDGLVPCGSTGEAATLSHAEHSQVVRHVVEVVAGRVPVIAGAGSNSTREAVELSCEAKQAGADAALLISPYYNRPTQEGIFHHYRAVAEEAEIPLVVYNIPGRTASRIESETLVKLSGIDGIIGLKESGGDLMATSLTIASAEAGFAVVSGDDALALPMLAVGGRGVITTTGNIAPRDMGAITRRFLAGDIAGARTAHEKLLPLMDALFRESNPIPVKTAAAILGRIPGSALRLPLTPMRKAHRDHLEAVLREVQPS